MKVLGRFSERCRHRLYTLYCEYRFGVATGGFIEARDLGVENPDSMSHSPLEYEHIFWALDRIPFRDEEVVFLDYGSGKGRVLTAAAALPFRKVLGVEISERLAAAARANLARMKHRRAGEAEVVVGDAAHFEIPPDVNVIFLFNPFVGQTLTEVVCRMERSVCANPRDLFVISFNHAEFDRRVRDAAWIEKVHETPICGLYRTLTARYAGSAS